MYIFQMTIRFCSNLLNPRNGFWFLKKLVTQIVRETKLKNVMVIIY